VAKNLATYNRCDLIQREMQKMKIETNTQGSSSCLPLLLGAFFAMPLRMTFVLLSLACLLLNAMQPHATAAADITSSQREAIEDIIHDYLMQNTGVLTEALHRAEDKLKRDANAKARKALIDRRDEIFDDPATPVGGDPKGSVSIVEFFDYRCPYCKQVLPLLQTLMDQYSKLRLVYKEMPILGRDSVVAAQAALAARRQDKYEAFHAALMATRDKITEDIVYKVAGSVGLDLDRLKEDMSSPQLDQAIKANLALANALDIHGTPGFVIGDRIVREAIDLDTLKSLIAEAQKE
jgi:protein-disulfide isomerase